MGTDPTLLVLTSLAEGDKHGYAMMVDIAEFSGASIGPGTLYGAITRLEQRGWIEPVGPKERRQPYAITGAGREYLTQELEKMQCFSATAQKRLSPA